MAQLSRTKTTLLSLAVLLLVLLVVLIPSFVVVVDAGQIGVVKLFGKVSDNTMASGIHVKNPFAKVIKMSIRTEEYTMSSAAYEGKKVGDDSIQAMASDGASVWLDVTVFYHLDSKSAPKLYKEIGLDYSEIVIRPEIRGSIRSAVSKFQINEIYSTKRDDLVTKIQDDLTTSLSQRGVTIEEVLLRNVIVSETLSSSIEEKLTAQQEAQKLDFLLEREKKEAERKVIEAKGQRDAQSIINQSLTDKYLYYMYVNSLKDREGTIYVPTEGGLPLFKGVN